MREIAVGPGFESWQAAARRLLREGVSPADVTFRERPVVPADPAAPDSEPQDTGMRVPRRFVDLARGVAPHRDPARWPLLYSVLWRLVHDSRELLESGDPEVARLLAMEAAVAEGREVIGAGPFVPPRASATLGDRGAALSARGAALSALVAAAARCTGCVLYRHASRTVFGQGSADARVVMVGEQPGDHEDLQGAPFVGPAGEVFDRALAEVGLPRERLYVTNAVKHFKFVVRGTRRIHQTPAAADLAACRPWIEAELAVLDPEILVCLGATAARALLGPAFRIMRDHGRFVDSPWAKRTMATLHPSAILRGEDETTQARLYTMLRDDLQLIAQTLSGSP